MYNDTKNLPQVSYLEKKVTELESDSLANGDLKSKLKQENTQLVHRWENTHTHTHNNPNPI